MLGKKIRKRLIIETVMACKSTSLNLTYIMNKLSTLLSLLLLGIIIMPHSLFSQNNRHTCGTDRLLQLAIEKDPTLLDRLNKEEEALQKRLATDEFAKASGAVLTIPVVVHVLHYDREPDSNISDEQIYSQIDELNRIFSLSNSNKDEVRDEFKDIQADVEIEFCMARVDPNGNPTFGITRKEVDVRQYEMCDQGSVVGQSCELMKYTSKGGITAWPTEDYLNIWVVNGLSDGVIGYAYIPDTAPNSNVDGLVMCYWAFGTVGNLSSPYNGGRTAAHEIGHWLNLYHPWGRGNDAVNCSQDDFVSDTPPTSQQNYGCNFSANSCGSGTTGDLPDMVENYMDYTNDACQNIFTGGQKVRMRATISGTGKKRNVADNAIACISTLKKIDAAIVSATYPLEESGNCTVFSPVVEITNFGEDPIFFAEIEYGIVGGEETYKHLWQYDGADNAGIQSLGKAEAILPEIGLPKTLLPSATSSAGLRYELFFVVNNPNFEEDLDPDNNSHVHSFTTVLHGYKKSLYEQFERAFFPPIDWEQNERNVFEKIEGLSSGAGMGAMYINNFEYDGLGNTDIMHFRKLDIGVSNDTIIEFDYAYAPSSTGAEDELLLLISVDCLESFDTLFHKKGADLATVDPIDDAPFMPENESDWQHVLINIAQYKNSRNALLQLHQIRGEGNNIFFDNFQFYPGFFPVGTTPNPQIQETISCYPNPAKAYSQLVLPTPNQNSQEWQVQIFDKLGRQVYADQLPNYPTNGEYTLPTNNWVTGVYFVQVTDGTASYQTKLVVL